MAKRKRITQRTAQRLIRAAYEYEHLATVLRIEGFLYTAGAVKQISTELGKAGRHLEDMLTARG